MGSYHSNPLVVEKGMTAPSASISRAGAKREVQVTAMVDSTVGMVDLHGIMDHAMPEISAIDDRR
jgi:hypothetical protein